MAGKLDDRAAISRQAPLTDDPSYGAFTTEDRQADRLLFVGAGVGSAPLLAVLQALPTRADIVVVLRASTREELVLRDEIAAEVRHRDGRLIALPG